MATIPPTPYTIQCRPGRSDYAQLERAANSCLLEAAPCACGGVVWVRVWPEPDPAMGHAILYDAICSACRWQPNGDLHWTAEAAIAAWNAVREENTNG